MYLTALGAVRLVKTFHPVQPHTRRGLAEAGPSGSPISQLTKLTQGRVAAAPRGALRGADGTPSRGGPQSPKHN